MDEPTLRKWLPLPDLNRGPSVLVAPAPGLEPGTPSLTAKCSKPTELRRPATARLPFRRPEGYPDGGIFAIAGLCVAIQAQEDTLVQFLLDVRPRRCIAVA